jgi:hypothetical protein
MLKGNKFKLQRGTAAKTEGEDRNNGGENQHHAVTVRLVRENLQPLSGLWKFEQPQVPGRAVASCNGQRRTQGADPAGKQKELSRSLRRHRGAG